MYGYKTRVSVFPNSIALACTDPDPGFVSDITMLLKMDCIHSDATEKRVHDCSTPDRGPMVTLCPANWATQSEKGYQGTADSLRVLYPTKKLFDIRRRTYKR